MEPAKCRCIANMVAGSKALPEPGETRRVAIECSYIRRLTIFFDFRWLYATISSFVFHIYSVLCLVCYLWAQVFIHGSLTCTTFSYLWTNPQQISQSPYQLVSLVLSTYLRRFCKSCCRQGVFSKIFVTSPAFLSYTGGSALVVIC